MNDSIYVISVSLMLILLGGLTFHRLTRRTIPEGARALLRPSGRLALMGILLTTAYVISLPGIYAMLEVIMPLSNGTDLVAKSCAMTAVAFLGVHLAIAYNSETALRWIVGMRGALALGIAVLGVFITLTAADTPEASPRLVDYADQPAVELNEWIVLAYTAYVLGPLLLPLFRDSRRNPLRIGRLASRLIFVGFALSIARALAYPLELRAGAEAFHVFELVTHVSTACVVLGLWAFAFARSRQLARKTFDTSLSIGEETNVNQTPPEAKQAVERILTKANPENEAAYAVIFRAVRICIEAGMSRRQTASYLGVSARRIDEHGQYFRTAKSVRTMFEEAFHSRSIDVPAEDAKTKLIQWAWKS